MSKVLANLVAGQVRAELARTRIPQKRVAEVLGTSRAAVCRRLSGEIPFDVAELEAIAELLGIPVTQLLERAA